MANNHSETERRLWEAADQFRANSELKSSEYAVPVLGLIFLRYADHQFTQAEQELEGKGSGRRKIGKEDYQAKGVMYLPPKARFSHLLALPEGENIGKAINEAMKAVEADNEELRGVLPRTYTKIDNVILASLLKNFSQIAVDAQGDKFGKIYEYFLGNFARAEGQRGGEFFTPTTMVQLIVEILEPHHGRLMDHSCGSGGKYVQSAKFIKAHQHDPSREISIFGQERVEETRNLCLMNLAVHGLSGDIKQGNSYYEDLHDGHEKFHFVMANPPFNVDKVDKEKIKDDPRFPFGMPRSDNANYLWIQLFYSSLNESGRAGFVMANSAADARQSEMEIRKAMLQAHAVDVMVASYAYLHAVAARPGFGCAVASRIDDGASVDALIRVDEKLGTDSSLWNFPIEVQLKATKQKLSEKDGRYSYFFKGIKRYDRLREPGSPLPKLLVVLLLPDDPTQWLTSDENSMISRKCAYWVSLHGAQPSDNDTGTTIAIPRAQLLTVEALRELATRLSREESVHYVI